MNEHVDPLFAAILEKMENVNEPRWSRQERLDQLIRDFSPDYNEAEELLDALFAGFKHRYSDGEWMRIEQLLETFKDKLYRIQTMEPQPEEADDPE